MSVTKETTIWCDGWDGTCGKWESDALKAPEIRKRLKHRGWTHEGGKDYCPLCTQIRKEGKKA